ncbi:phosphate acyltransferase PlsX [Bacillus alkalicellulosilyticus]|uniref:phosphate acyltransferase PlsX n=1 Tax=Alkalihalobacterium alkalicellulosilyticum TaxID=1912214 RepID=UPI0009984A05|nr:phosphate acyltransferase PlsX [Bacillus alkalicellulosilyticus]
MRIAIDVMGGEKAPKAPVEAAINAIKKFPNLEITLVGKEEEIRKYLSDETRITIIHTDEMIEDEDVPTTAVRRKKNASMVLTVKEVKEGRADACVSAGNTGALMTAGLLLIGRINGIDRPALAPMLPTLNGEGFLLLDVGANMDAKPEHLLQYAIMGNIYMKMVRKVRKPRVGLLNVGTEEGKGNELMKQTFPLLQEGDYYFLGNIEARDLLEGVADVVVCDGFSGNLVLKSTEGAGKTLFSLIKRELTSTFFSKVLAGMLKPSFLRIKKTMDYTEYGGAALFGLKAPVIKSHGSSDEKAFYNTILQAKEMVDEQVITTIKNEVAKYNSKGE